MKKGLRNALLSAVIIVLVSGAGVWAYIALTGTIGFEVKENLSFVGSSDFVLDGYPGQSIDQRITIANASPDEMEIDVGYTVSPDPSGGISVNVPKKITVPGAGELDIIITIIISKSASPTSYDIAYEIIR